MGLINDEAAAQVREVFESLVNPVRLAVFSQTLGDPASGDVKRLIEELCALDSRLSVESCNFVLDTEKVEAYRIARTPAIAVLGAEKDYGIRFYGIPSGYEFQTLVHAILDVSAGESGLLPETRAALAEVGKDVQIQVFSTPT